MKRCLQSPWFWFWLPIVVISAAVVAVRGLPEPSEVRAENSAVFHYQLF